jgi:hypothetical protein
MRMSLIDLNLESFLVIGLFVISIIVIYKIYHGYNFDKILFGFWLFFITMPITNIYVIYIDIYYPIFSLFIFQIIQYAYIIVILKALDFYNKSRKSSIYKIKY